MYMRKQLVAAVGAGAVALLLVAPMPASAAAKPKVKEISTAVQAPFNLDVSTGKILVADGGANAIVKVKKSDGSVKTVVEAVGPDGVAVSKDRRYLAHTTTVGGEEGITASGLVIIGPKGTVNVDTLAYERANNPDAKLTYGVDNPSDCVKEALGPEANYRGLVDSHAYSVAAYGKKFVVADAGANTLWLVDRKGTISTIGVLPRHPQRISAAVAKNLGVDCGEDLTYSFEAVPTDVEVGKDGWLYVSTLPGGPEDPSLGARGRVYRVNPKTGKNKLIARGFAGATNLALGKRGEIYITELFAGRISVVKNGKVKPYVSLPGALSVETDRKGNLWAGTGITGPSSIVKISKKK
jgi:hypothetical protein